MKVRPMIMQLAEPEYMCPVCGVKFYSYSGERPEKCSHCNTEFDWYPSKKPFISVNESPCDHCSNNPKNGGSGICMCTLGTPKITC